MRVNEVWQWAHIHGIHHVSHHPEAAALIEWQNGLLKTQLQHELGGNLQSWGNVLQDAIYALNQCHYMVLFLPSQDSQVKESRDGNGSVRHHSL